MHPYPAHPVPDWEQSMSKRTDLTAQAAEGYAGAPLTYLASSPSWFAYRLGEYLKRTGRCAPSDVRMGRGYHVHANGMLFAFDAHNAIVRVS